MATTSQATETSFHVGQLVRVAPRTWPGINQPGGIGRVTGLGWHTLSVRYVLDGRHDKEISTKFVTVHQQGRTRRLRDRSMMLGRCNVCGSLRNDCGSCDLWMEEEQVRANVLLPLRKQKVGADTALEDDSDDESSSDDELEEMQKQNQRRYRKYLRMKARVQSYLAQNSSSSSDSDAAIKTDTKSDNQRGSSDNDNGVGRNSNSSSDDDDGEDLPLQQLAWQATQMESPPHRRKRPSQRQPLPLPGASSTKRRPPNAARRLRTDQCSDFQDTPIQPARSIPLSRTRQLSPALSVASPGAQDGSDTSSAASGRQDLQKQEQPREAEDSPLFEAVEANEVDFPLPSGTQDGFIQPEGNADQLPDDIRDGTLRLPYSDLAPFFERIAAQLENDWIPDFKLRVTLLEQQWKRSTTAIVKDELLEQRYVALFPY